MEKNKVKEVLFELTGRTEVVKKVKVRLDKTIDIENLSSTELEELVKEKFLRKSDNYGGGKSFQTEIVKILTDEDCDTFEQERDELIYMSTGNEYGYNLPKISLGSCSHLTEYNIKSVLSFGNLPTDKYVEITPDEPFLGCYTECMDYYFLTKEKEEIIEIWNNKDFKSIKNDSVMTSGTPPLKMYQNLFEKELPNKEQQKMGGVFLLVITDLDSYQTNNCSKDTTILGKIRIK